MNLIINGEPRPLDTPITVATLLNDLCLVGKRLAVERNGDIVPRSQFEQIWLEDGDRLEIVVAVGGG